MTASDRTEHVVVFRAQSSARFPPDKGWEISINAPQLKVTAVRFRVFTRWINIDGKEIPRELIIEASGLTESTGDAAAKIGTIARPLATLLGFVANTRVGTLEEHIAYEGAPHDGQRQFLEVFLPDEHGPVSPGALVRPHLLDTCGRSLIEFGDEYPRLDRALRQYELALREWRVGGEWLALSHLWIAAENLTKIVIRKTAADKGISQEQLARSYQIVTDDPTRPHWIDLLGARIRRDVIFEGDNKTYKLAKEASNGLEHGYLTLDEVTKNALKCTYKTFSYVRRTIVDLLELPADVAQELVEIELKDVQSFRKVARGRLLGNAADPALEGELYPRLEWTSSVDSTDREGRTFRFRLSETLTIRTNPKVGFQLDSFEIHERLEHGSAPIQLSDQDIQLKHTPASPIIGLLAAVLPLVESAAASGTDIAHSQASAYAFNLFGQAVAYFKGADLLVRANQPVEALPLFLSLTILAARFEQMDSADGPGLGIAARAAIDSIHDVGGKSETATLLENLIREGCAAIGLIIPDALPLIEESYIYRSLQVEMQIASHIKNSYNAVGLHLQRTDSDHALFQSCS